MSSHPVPKVGDTVVLNDWGIGQVFGEGVVRALQHMKTLKMKVTKVATQSLTEPELTFPVSVDNGEINRFLIDHNCFDIVNAEPAQKPKTNLFVLVVEGKEARSGSPGNPVITDYGDKFVVVNEPDGWVEATSRNWKDGQEVPTDAKVFKSVGDAEKFAKRWKGHPWWCMPNGNFEIIPVEPQFEGRLKGYKRAGKGGA